MSRNSGRMFCGRSTGQDRAKQRRIRAQKLSSAKFFGLTVAEVVADRGLV